MMGDPSAMNWPAFVQSLSQGVENEACMCRLAHPPADDARGESTV